MLQALDSCVDVLVRQMRRNKTRLEKKFKSAPALDMSEFIGTEEEEKEISEDSFELVRTKEIPLKPQSTEEAILQMNMLGHKFYMFINDETDEVNVVYSRSDGGYGLLIPEKS